MSPKVLKDLELALPGACNYIGKLYRKGVSISQKAGIQ